MKKILKWTGIVLASLIVIILAAAFIVKLTVDSRLNKIYTVKPLTLTLPTDSASLAQGKHRASLCQGCHGEDLAGMVIFQNDAFGTISAPNLTSGKGSTTKDYSNEDWVRTIRHGIRKNGRPLFVMPSMDFVHFSESDLAALIAFLKSVPPVDKESKQSELTFLSKVMVGLGAFGNVIHAEVIPHEKSFASDPGTGVTQIHGEYLVNISGCRTCHGEDLSGGKDPNPEAPPSPNLTQGGPLAKWTATDFISFMRTGRTLEGKEVKKAFMPWDAFGKMTDEELSAVFLYLQSIPKKENAVK